MQLITWEQYLDLSRELINELIHDVLTRHVSYTDPEIIAILHSLKMDIFNFCGSHFADFYRGKEHFGEPHMGDDALFNRVRRDIDAFKKLLEKVDEIYDNIQHSRKEDIWHRFMYGARRPGEW